MKSNVLLMIAKQMHDGIIFLASQQLKDGSFISLSSSDPTSFEKASISRANFPTILILQCLNELNSNHELEKMKKNAARYILSQKSKYWSFNYWAKNSQEARTMPYPDDLDDTFCALAALYRYDPNLIDGRAMGSIVKLLTTLEYKEGGPYFTWLVSSKAEKIWRDVDLVVNCNIAYFLSLQKISLPNIVELVETHIDLGNPTSSYYPSFEAICYFISRFYRRRKKKTLIKLLLAQRDGKGTWKNPLSTALAISALLNFGVASSILEPSISYLLQEQQKNGSWQAYALYPDPVKQKKLFYAGSSALTTAFCFEALIKFEKAKKEKRETLKSKGTSSEDILYKNIITRVEERFANLTSVNKRVALTELHKVLKADKTRQISLLPSSFRWSLKNYYQKVPDDFVIKTSTANVLGWLAYTLYDNFFDGEADPKTLAIANIALRELTIIFDNLLPGSRQFRELFSEVMDKLEEANMWECSVCRINVENGRVDLNSQQIPNYNDYTQLAQKSFGHVLGPLAVLFYLGFKRNSPEVVNSLSFFKDYLIARQLNDDAHDWEKDFMRGYINPAASTLLQTYLQNKSEESGKIKNLLPKLRDTFWSTSIVTICQIILEHIHSARQALYSATIIEDYSVFEEMLQPLEQAAKKAASGRVEMIKFLKTYK